MLAIALNRGAEMHFSWHGAQFERTFRRGDLILLPNGLPSRCRWTGVVDEALIVYFAPRFLHRLVEQDWDRDAGDFELHGRAGFADPAIVQLGQMLRDAVYSRGAAGERLLIESLATALGILVLRAGTALPVPQAARGGLAPAVLARLVEYMEANLAEPIGLADLASLAGCGPQHLKRAFKGSTGEPPHQFLLARRVARAQTLLEASELKITEIALACGFADQSHFTTAFRKRTRLTPERWRRLGRV